MRLLGPDHRDPAIGRPAVRRRRRAPGSPDPAAALRAFELADSTTDREKFFILGSYYERAANQPEKAAAAYEALLRLYPDHYWGNNNLTDIYVRTGRMHETTERWVHLADLRPKDLHCNRMAAQSLANEAAWNQAERYIARALELLQEEGESDRPNEADELRLLVMRQDEFKGDIAKQHADLLVADRENKTMPAFLLGRLFLGFGELREARAHLAGNNVAGAVIAYSCGDFSKANELLDVRQQMDPLRLDLAASVLIRLGRLNDAEILHQRMLPLFSDSELPRIQVVEGQLALARGQTE